MERGPGGVARIRSNVEGETLDPPSLLVAAAGELSVSPTVYAQSDAAFARVSETLRHIAQEQCGWQVQVVALGSYAQRMFVRYVQKRYDIDLHVRFPAEALADSRHDATHFIDLMCAIAQEAVTLLQEAHPREDAAQTETPVVQRSKRGAVIRNLLHFDFDVVPAFDVSAQVLKACRVCAVQGSLLQNTAETLPMTMTLAAAAAATRASDSGSDWVPRAEGPHWEVSLVAHELQLLGECARLNPEDVVRNAVGCAGMLRLLKHCRNTCGWPGTGDNKQVLTTVEGRSRTILVRDYFAPQPSGATRCLVS